MKIIMNIFKNSKLHVWFCQMYLLQWFVIYYVLNFAFAISDTLRVAFPFMHFKHYIKFLVIYCFDFNLFFGVTLSSIDIFLQLYLLDVFSIFLFKSISLIWFENCFINLFTCLLTTARSVIRVRPASFVLVINV